MVSSQGEIQIVSPHIINKYVNQKEFSWEANFASTKTLSPSTYKVSLKGAKIKIINVDLKQKLFRCFLKKRLLKIFFENQLFQKILEILTEIAVVESFLVKVYTASKPATLLKNKKAVARSCL